MISFHIVVRGDDYEKADEALEEIRKSISEGCRVSSSIGGNYEYSFCVKDDSIAE